MVPKIRPVRSASRNLGRSSAAPLPRAAAKASVDMEKATRITGTRFIGSLRIMDFQDRGPLREGMEKEILVIVEIVDARRHAPIVADPVFGAGVDHEISGKTLIGLGDGIAIVDGAETAVAVTRANGKGPTVIGTICRHRIGFQLG